MEALLKAKENVSFSKKIEIEVETLDDAIECVKNGADIVMLDNMTPDEVGEVIVELEKLNIRQNSLIEVSGGITEETILDYAGLGVDIISIGALTHSSRSLNFSLKFDSIHNLNDNIFFSSSLLISVMNVSSLLMAFPAKSIFLLLIASMASSSVPLVMNLYTITSFFCPIL